MQYYTLNADTRAGVLILWDTLIHAHKDMDLHKKCGISESIFRRIISGGNLTDKTACDYIEEQVDKKSSALREDTYLEGEEVAEVMMEVVDEYNRKHRDRLTPEEVFRDLYLHYRNKDMNINKTKFSVRKR